MARRGSGARRTAVRWSALAAVALVLALVAPVLIAGLTLWDDPWTPVGDEAVIALRVDDVGSSSTPLVGAYSTRGWSHPGPILYAILAVPHALGGLSETSMFVATALLNALVLAAVGLAAWRLGRLPLVLVTSVGLAWLVHGLRPETVVSFWNPYIALLPYVLFLFATWAVTARHWRWLPVAAATGSILVQLHVAYASLVGAAAIAAVLWLRHTRTGEPGQADGPPRRPVRLAVGATALLWAPVVWDLAFGSHNLARVTAYFPRPKEHAAGIATGFGILSRHLLPTGPWSGGDEVVVFLDVQPGSVLPLVVLVAAAGALGLACARRGRTRTAGLLAVVLAQLVAGALSATRIEEPILAYLVVWMLPLAMVTWVALAWAAWDLWSHRAERPAPSPRRATGLVRPTRGAVVAVLTAALVGIPLARTGSAWLDPPVPRQQHAAAVRSVIGQIDEQFDSRSRLRVEAVGDSFNEVGAGVIAGLIRDGYTVYTSDGAAAGKWGATRAWAGQPVDATITLAVGGDHGDDGPIAVCALAPGATRVAAFEALLPAELEELRWLALERYLQGGLLHPDRQRRFDELEQRSFRMAAFEASNVCAT